MPFALYDLRSEILRGAAQGPSPIRQLLREPEVRDLQMSILGQEKVLRFQVPVHDVTRV